MNCVLSPKGLFLAVFFGFSYLLGADTPLKDQPKSLTVRSYELEVSFVPEESRMEGQALMTFGDYPESLSEIVFYLHGELSVESIGEGSTAWSFSQEKVLYAADYSMIATRVVVDLKERSFDGVLTVQYGGYFHPSKARSPSDYMRIDPSGVYLRSFGYSLWFPVFLEAEEDSVMVSFPRVVLRTPRDYTAVFVGERLSEKVSGSWRVSEWQAKDISVFAAQCTAQRFSVHREGNYFVYSWKDEKSRQAAPQIADFATRLNGLLRTFYRKNATAEQIHIVEMPRYGDISSSNVIGLSSSTWLGFQQAESAKRTLAHEFVHPFVELGSEPNEPLRAMVIEGFPSYFHLPVLAELLGQTYYDHRLDEVQRLYLERKVTGLGWRGSTLPPEKPLTEINEDEIGIYKDRFVLNDRALLFLDYLRRNMGLDNFRHFASDLFRRVTLSREEFGEIILAHLPGVADDLRLWLETSDYPERFQRPGVAP